jgi:CDP-glucose 4,6-dehydratase
MASVVEAFWKNKRVFLTGHTGFKGSWLSIWLHKMGADVTGYALNPPTTPSLFVDAQVSKLLNSNMGDVRDFENLRKCMVAADPELVIHMAAQPLVRYSYANPIETYMTNVMGTVHLLESVKSAKSVKAVVNVTTDKCYENKEWHWGYRENEPMGGYDPYSSSKGCSELVTSAFRDSYFGNKNKNGVFVASARAGNVIGGGDWAMDRLIPDIMRALINGETIKIRNPRSIRPWQHVLEPLSGYLMLAQNLYESGEPFAQAFNFGPLDSDVKEVEWIVKKMTDLWGCKDSYRFEKDLNSLHEATYLKLDCSKAVSLLKWQPSWDLATALESIVSWSKFYQINSQSVQEICLSQIQDFESDQLKNGEFTL